MGSVLVKGGMMSLCCSTRWQEAAARKERQEEKKRADKARADVELIAEARRAQAASKILAQAAVAKAEQAEFNAVLAKLKQEEQLSKLKVCLEMPWTEERQNLSDSYSLVPCPNYCVEVKKGEIGDLDDVWIRIETLHVAANCTEHERKLRPDLLHSLEGLHESTTAFSPLFTMSP